MKKLALLLCILALSLILPACTNKTPPKEQNPATAESAIDISIPSEDKSITKSQINEKIKLAATTILSGKIEVLIPESFAIMPDELLKIKYPLESRPTLVYTNESASVNVAFNYTENEATAEDLTEMLDLFINVFTDLYPSAQWYRTGIEMINERKVGVLELVMPAEDTEIYNLIWFTELDGRLMMASFNCTIELEEEWKGVGIRILESFRVV